MPVRIEVKVGFSDSSEVWYEVRGPLADRAPAGLIPLGDTMHWPGMAGDPLVAFAAARLGEDEASAQVLAADMPYLDAMSARVAAGGSARALREVEARRAIIGSQTSDHAPVETMYGLCCRTCVTWQDAPLAEGGETEFGIAIPQPWPCKVARSVVASWSGHPQYRKDEWAL